MSLDQMNEFVNMFFKQCGNPELTKKWMSDENQAKIRKKVKKPKLVGKPKRLTAWNIFYKDKKSEYKATTRISAEWKTLKESGGKEYERYLELAEVERVRYNDEMGIYAVKNNIDFKPMKKTKVVDPSTPKRTNPYIYFCKENRQKLKDKYPKKSGREITALLSVEWSMLKIEDGDEYKKYATMGLCDTLAKTHKKQVQRAGQSLVEFCKTRRKELKQEQPTLTPKEITQIINDEWKEQNV